ncbi:phage T7 F exclusion suppressor FxsA [Roseimaritima multifibrata]|uniref:Phage T7 F exclusion suppressor FxsA n=1 Tax=Roseimaritima multifibrata TaxID=1930274 RepID=A0A517MBN7_9BACT|nr:FxsA family protein [Roseimaritima multifibrata]QDS92271.1 phage T7 F exclusion suppressor FxsA [Roseimaritima multifibrata]
MLWRIFLAFTLIPLIELYLLWKITLATSLPVTILLVLVTGFIGSMLARSQGIRAWQRFHAAIGEGRMPAQEIQHGLLIAFAAAMLLTPGLVTDVAGFVLLVPFTREWVRKYFAARLKNSFQLQVTTFAAGGASRPAGGSDVVEAEGVRPVDSNPKGVEFRQ